MSALPHTTEERKGIPLARGVLDYFPAALAEVAKVSKAGNAKHNPGQDMHHARGKSTDHADCILRHLVDRGEVDPETGQRHSAMVAWRALALLQEELEAAGEAPLARGAKLPEALTAWPVDVPEIPKGWRIVDWREPVEGEHYLYRGVAQESYRDMDDPLDRYDENFFILERT
jgi:hypothetical protein